MTHIHVLVISKDELDKGDDFCDEADMLKFWTRASAAASTAVGTTCSCAVAGSPELLN